MEPVSHIIKVKRQREHERQASDQSFAMLLKQEQQKTAKPQEKKKNPEPIHLMVNMCQYNSRAREIHYFFSSEMDYKA